MTEIDALKTIDEALASLEDNATRDRVLRWACQKYSVGAPPAVTGSDHTAVPNPPAKVPPAKPKGKSRAKAGSSASPSIVRDLNLKPKGRDPFDQFAAKKNPGSNQHKCVVAVYYLRHELNLSSITVDHVYTCFKHMQWRAAASLANNIVYVSSVHRCVY